MTSSTKDNFKDFIKLKKINTQKFDIFPIIVKDAFIDDEINTKYLFLQDEQYVEFSFLNGLESFKINGLVYHN